MIFSDRKDAGIKLADRLLLHLEITHAERDNLLILSIPRGGIIVGVMVSQILGCPHDILIVKKIGFPGHEELAMGAVVEDGTVLLDHEMIARHNLAPDSVQTAITTALDKVKQYVQTFRCERTLNVEDKTVTLIDEGVATGETMKAAICWLTQASHQAQKIIIAVPVGAPRTIIELGSLVDAVIYLQAPANFIAVGQYYRNFDHISDKSVLETLYPGA